MRIDPQQVELFFVAFFMDGGEEHTAGLYTHYNFGRWVGDLGTGLFQQINLAQKDLIFWH